MVRLYNFLDKADAFVESSQCEIISAWIMVGVVVMLILIALSRNKYIDPNCNHKWKNFGTFGKYCKYCKLKWRDWNGRN